MPGFYTYTAFGLAIQSEIALPLMASASADSGPALKIVRGKISEALKQQAAQRLYTPLENGDVVCHAPQVAFYQISLASGITVDPVEGAPAEAIQLFLLGSALGVVLHQQGGLVIHGCAVQWEDTAMIFSGPSGIGKSTLAMAFVQAGGKLLTDDVALIRFDTDNRPVVWPAYPQVKLWQDTLAQFNARQDGLTPIHNRVNKFNVPVADAFHSTPLALNSLFILGTHPDKAGSRTVITRLSGQESYQALHNNTYRIQYLSEIGNAKNHFAACARLLHQVIIYQFTRPENGYAPDKMVQDCNHFLKQDVLQ